MTPLLDDVDDVENELYGTRVPRVDAVAGPAHGIPFHIIKAGELGRLTKEQSSMADELADTVADGTDEIEPAAAGETVDPENDPAAHDPGSPSWEAIDAAKARETLVGLTAVKQLIGCLSDREQTEGDSDDLDNAADLSAAADAVDFALGVLAKFAVTEQAEADQGMAEIEAQAEALGITKALDRVKIEKAGKVFSASNTQSLTQIRDLANGMLAQLEKAPDVAEGGEPVKLTKAADLSAMPGPLLQLLEQFLAAASAWQSTQDDTAGPAVDDTAPGVDPAAPADPTAVPAADPTAAPAADPTAAPAAPETPADPAPAPAPADPSTDPAPAPAPGDDEDTVQKSQSGPVGDDLVERLTKSMSDAVTAAVKPLEERITKMEAQPAPGGPFLAGQLPPAHMLRGQDTGAANPLDAVRKSLGEIDDPQQRAALAGEAVTALLQQRIADRRG